VTTTTRAGTTTNGAAGSSTTATATATATAHLPELEEEPMGAGAMLADDCGWDQEPSDDLADTQA
jgi:hypothetical protein